jgi:UDP-glucose:(heptosyl)LPS alpha-1,3-glucosyltransferase
LKFAFVIFKYFPFGGVQRDMLRIANDCISAGHHVVIYTGEWRGDMPDSRIEVSILPSKGWLNHQRHQSLINHMQSAIAHSPVDLVLGFNRMSGLDVYYAADPCYIERAQEQRSLLYRLTGRYRFFAKCEEAVMGIASHTQILLLTLREKVSFQKWYHTPDERFKVLPPSIPLALFENKHIEDCRQRLRNEFGLPREANVVLTVGSAFIRKGVDRVIDAMASLPKEILDITWLLAIGEYESNSNIQTYCEAAGIAHRCIHAGGRKDIADLMLGADVLAHPARSELAGIVIIEAITAGLPVLVTDVCGYAEHVEKANAGVVLSSPYSQIEMNIALAQMLQSSERPLWKVNGKKYTQKINDDNSKSAEADYIIAYAQKKRDAKNFIKRDSK